MRVFIYSKEPVKKLKKMILRKGFVVSKYKPDIVVTYGDNGIVLEAEREFPGVPKLIVKNSKIRHRYEVKEENFQDVLKKIKSKNYQIVESIKVIANYKRKKLIGLNEIQVHTKVPIKALRFSVQIDEKKIDNLIGDGVVVSTPFGSTGYYKSLGCNSFRQGIGVAFNNIHNKKVECEKLPITSVVKIKIIKGIGVLASDNNPRMYTLTDGDEVVVTSYKEKAKFIQVL